MKSFGGPVLFLDRDNINTDEIIPAKYLTEISKTALKPHLLEDLQIDGKSPLSKDNSLKHMAVVVTRKNFGCGSSREHAVWAFEVNDITVIIAESFARIFRQNMFNCGILAIELGAQEIQELFDLQKPVAISVDVESGRLIVDCMDDEKTGQREYQFVLHSFDKALVTAGGWLEYADSRY